MQKRIFRYFLIVIAFLTVFLSVSVYKVAYDRYDADLEAQLSSLCDVIGQELADDGLDAFIARRYTLPEKRLTVIRTDGSVAYDTDAAIDGMDSHLERQEVQQALSSGAGSANRRSDTTGKTYKYVAKAVGNGLVVRVSMDFDYSTVALGQVAVYILFAAVLGFALAALASFWVSRRFTRPILALADFARRAGQPGAQLNIMEFDDELRMLADEFNAMTAQLHDTIDKLHLQSAQTAAVLDSMNSALLAIDQNNRILLINHRAAELLGLPSDAIAGRDVYEMLRVSPIRSFLESGEEDGKLQYRGGIYRLSSSPIGDAGEVLGRVILITDVTKMTELESMRTDFVSNVSHELKTPLTSIRGFIETLKEGGIEDKKVAYQFLDIIDIEARRLQNLINDILKLSKIETMKSEQERTAFQIKDVAEEVAVLLQDAANEKNLTISIDDQLGRPVYANRDRIKQILINLTGNAVEYNRPGGKVDIQLRAEGENAVIAVSDTGIGIAAKHLPRLFERFYRVDTARSRTGGSTGLGLSIVKHIAALYGGSASVESEEGIGSTFTVKLPILEGWNHEQGTV